MTVAAFVELLARDSPVLAGAWGRTGDVESDTDRLMYCVRRLVEENRRLVSGMRPAPPLLTVAEAASIARAAPGTVRRWIAVGRLAGCKLGRRYRVRRGDLAELLGLPGEDMVVE